jgi:hypothetical protein
MQCFDCLIFNQKSFFIYTRRQIKDLTYSSSPVNLQGEGTRIFFFVFCWDSIAGKKGAGRRGILVIMQKYFSVLLALSINVTWAIRAVTGCQARAG